MKNVKAYIIDLLLSFYLVLLIRYLFVDLNEGLEWVKIYTSLAIAIVLSSGCFTLKRASLGKVIMQIDGKTDKTPMFARFTTWFAVVILIFTLITGFKISQVSFDEFFSEDGLAGAERIFVALSTPNFAIFDKVLLAAIETIYMALIATFFAIPVAFLLSFFAARNLMKGPIQTIVYVLIRTVLNISRSIEPLVWAIIFSVWVGIGPFAGMLALMIHSVASLTKLYSEQIEEIDEGPVEAMKAVGASNILVVWYGIVPQLVNPFLSYTIYRWDINVRMATIIGMVGGGGIGNMLMQYQGLAKWHEVGMVILIIAVVVWIMDFASAKIRNALSN